MKKMLTLLAIALILISGCLNPLKERGERAATDPNSGFIMGVLGGQAPGKAVPMRAPDFAEAIVMLTNAVNSYTTVASGQGVFIFQDIPSGKYVGIATKPGQKPVIFPVEIETGQILTISAKADPTASAGSQLSLNISKAIPGKAKSETISVTLPLPSTISEVLSQAKSGDFSTIYKLPKGQEKNLSSTDLAAVLEELVNGLPADAAQQIVNDATNGLVAGKAIIDNKKSGKSKKPKVKIKLSSTNIIAGEVATLEIDADARSPDTTVSKILIVISERDTGNPLQKNIYTPGSEHVLLTHVINNIQPGQYVITVTAFNSSVPQEVGSKRRVLNVRPVEKNAVAVRAYITPGELVATTEIILPAITPGVYSRIQTVTDSNHSETIEIGDTLKVVFTLDGLSHTMNFKSPLVIANPDEFTLTLTTSYFANWKVVTYTDIATFSYAGEFSFPEDFITVVNQDGSDSFEVGDILTVNVSSLTSTLLTDDFKLTAMNLASEETELLGNETNHNWASLSQYDITPVYGSTYELTCRVILNTGLAEFYRKQIHVGSEVVRRLNGWATDKNTGDPIQGAAVVILGTGWVCSTDENGYYEFLDIPPGTYTVIIKRDDYVLETRTNVVIN